MMSWFAGLQVRQDGGRHIGTVFPSTNRSFPPSRLSMAFLPSSAALGKARGRPSVVASTRTQAAAHDVLLPSSPPSSFSDQPFGTLLAASDDLSAALTAPAPYQTFEPVVNVPALSAFAFVTVVFGLLQLRINQVQTAAERRKAALESLRVVKSLQLGADDFAAAAKDVDEEVDDTGTKPAGRSSISEASVRAALDEYEAALREELGLRQIVPGIRIVAPGDPKSAEADLAAARQFLGLAINDAGEVVPIAEGTAVQRSTGNENEEEGEKGMSTASKAVLLAVAVLQLGLLYLLSFDPMAATTDAGVFQ